MAYDKTFIANLALSLIRNKASITNIATDTSAQASAINAWYDQCLDMVLTDFDWGFARKRLTLTAHSETAPTEKWAYRYVYPSDCVQLRRLWNPTGTDKPVPFDIEHVTINKTITAITKASPAVVTATAHGFATGDEVYISSVAGMTEVNDITFVITRVSADTFSLNGIDSTLYTTYTSGGTAVLNTKSIVTNIDDAIGIYTYRLTNIPLFSGHARLALAYLIAHYIAGPMTGKKSIQEDMIGGYFQTLAAAGAHDANPTSVVTETPPEASWIQER